MTSLIFCFIATLALVNGKPAILPLVYNAFPNFHSTYPTLNSAIPYSTNIISTNQLLPNAIPYSTVKLQPIAPPAQVLTPAVQIVNPVSPIINKYHAQAEDGSYSFGYYGGPSSRAETRDNFGIVRGAFNYVDSEGKVQTQQYVADGLGFRVSGTNIPVVPEAPIVAGPEPVDYTPEVLEARNKFFEAFKKAESGIVDTPAELDGGIVETAASDSGVSGDHPVEVVEA